LKIRGFKGTQTCRTRSYISMMIMLPSSPSEKVPLQSPLAASGFPFFPSRPGPAQLPVSEGRQIDPQVLQAHLANQLRQQQHMVPAMLSTIPVPVQNPFSAVQPQPAYNVIDGILGAIQQRERRAAYVARLQQEIIAKEHERILADQIALGMLYRQQQQGNVAADPALKSALAAPQQQRVASDEKPLARVKTVPSERAALNLKQDCGSPREALQTLTMLGATLRSKSDPFIDASVIPDPGSHALSFRGGTSQFFPHKLYRLLEEMEKDGKADIISWLPHGRAFVVHKPEKFVDEILGKYFHGQTKWGSFSRQLQLYGFLRYVCGVHLVLFVVLHFRSCTNINILRSHLTLIPNSQRHSRSGRIRLLPRALPQGPSRPLPLHAPRRCTAWSRSSHLQATQRRRSGLLRHETNH